MTITQANYLLEMRTIITGMQEKLIEMEENSFSENEANSPDMHKIREAITGLEDARIALSYFDSVC